MPRYTNMSDFIDNLEDIMKESEQSLKNKQKEIFKLKKANRTLNLDIQEPKYKSQFYIDEADKVLKKIKQRGDTAI